MNRRQFLASAGLLLASPSLFASTKKPINVVEFVDFSCPHCIATAQYTPDIVKAVESTGGIFRIAPVGPIISDEPSRAVLVYYALMSATKNNSKIGFDAAIALYSGYANGAALDADDAVISWLSMNMTEKNDWKIVKQYIPVAGRRLEKSARLVSSFHVTDLPTFAVLNGMNSETIGVYRWAGSGEKITASVIDAIQKSQS